jgi:hypothetical protein
MVLVILLGALAVLLFLCVSNLVIELKLAKTSVHTFASGKSIQVRHTLGQGVIEAVGTGIQGKTDWAEGH